jgi:RNA polymerase sigma-70 factor (ECF subfamily)
VIEAITLGSSFPICRLCTVELMSDPEPNIAELLAQARQGDAAGRDQLFRQCRNYLGAVAKVQVESWLRAKVDASDLVQQTLFEAHRDFDRFQGQTEAEWLAWLRRILTHNALDHVRRYHGTAKRQAGRELTARPGGEKSTWQAEPRAPGPSPSEELIRRDEELRMATALARLTPDHRQVIVLRNLERLPFDQVAQRMGRSRPAVQMLWMRAIKKLQEVFDV